MGGGKLQINYKENWCVSYQSGPVESAWTIITMVTKDLGRQSLFIPVHSFPPLFSHIKSWKNIKWPAPRVVLALCEPQPSLPLPSVSMPPASYPPGFTPARLLCDVLSWAPFTLRDSCVRELESTLSDGHTSSCKPRVDSRFLSSGQCTHVCKRLLVLAVWLCPHARRRTGV